LYGEDEGCRVFAFFLGEAESLNYRDVLGGISDPGEDIHDQGKGKRIRRKLDDLEDCGFLASNGEKSGLRKYYNLTKEGKNFARLCAAILRVFQQENEKQISALKKKNARIAKVLNSSGEA
jgi:hypothetical protein